MTVHAAVLAETGAPLRIEAITLDAPGPGRVRVRLAAAGVCHSDLSLARGALQQRVPAVLGHEGAGTVVAVGDGVTAVRPGDRVLLNWSPSCRSCWWCTHGEPHLCEHATDAAAVEYARRGDGSALYPGLGVAAFATETIVPETSCVRLPEGTDLASAALIGCAVMTGVGAVRNAACVAAGESVVVIGLGGVGLSAVQGARMAGADPVIAVDPSVERVDLALRLGATHAVGAGADLAREVRALTGGRGADHAIECAGTAATIRATWSATRRGGTATIVGLGARGDELTFNALELTHFARTLRGCMFGSSDPQRDVPLLLADIEAGRLDVGAMVSHRVALDDLEAAFADMAAGRGARAVVVFEEPP